MTSGDEVRASICRYLVRSPGAHFRDVQRTLHLSPGQAAHHLRVLQRDGLIVERRQGRYAHFFPSSTPADERGKLGAMRHPARRALLEELERGPKTVKELAQATGMASSTLQHHMRALREAKLIEPKGVRPRRWHLRGLPPA